MLDVRTISEWLPAPRTAAVCAVSGGLDSMCLLDVLWDWCREKDVTLTAAHYHHGLRETADRDEAFVRDWCGERGIPFVSGRGDVRGYAAARGLSVEEAAREARYAFLRETAARCGTPEDFRETVPETSETVRRTENRDSAASPAENRDGAASPALIYTAHHAGDNAETVLLNLLRGTGLRGLGGMRHVRDGIVRPFLDVPRRELEAYAAANGIPHVEDETNADPGAAARNLVRLAVLPLLRELNPRAEERICETARQVREAEEFLEAEARRRTLAALRTGRAGDSAETNRTRTDRGAVYCTRTDGAGADRTQTARAERVELSRLTARADRVELSRPAFRDAPPCLRPRMVLCALDLLGAGRKDIGAVHLDAAASLAAGTAHGSGGGERTAHSPGGGEVRDGAVRTLHLPHGVTVRADRDTMTLERRPPSPAETELRPGVPVPWGAYRVTLWEKEPENRKEAVLSIHWDTGPVTVSPLRAGERLYLPGSNGSRTVKRLCADRRIPPEARDGLPAFSIGGRLAAVWPLGVDAAFAPEGGNHVPENKNRAAETDRFLPAEENDSRSGGKIRWITVEKNPDCAEGSVEKISSGDCKNTQSGVQ